MAKQTAASPEAKNMQQVMEELEVLLPPLVNLAETTFEDGSGDKKKAAVVGAALQFMQSMGVGAPPELVVAAMEEQLAKMKSEGTLGAVPIVRLAAEPAPVPPVADKPWGRHGATFFGGSDPARLD